MNNDVYDSDVRRLLGSEAILIVRRGDRAHLD